MRSVVEQWNSQYFFGRLSRECLDALQKIDESNVDLVNAADTWMHYFHLAGGKAENFSPQLSAFFARGAESYLPSLWAKIPPITRSGRHKALEKIIHTRTGLKPDSVVRFLDVGCGYPPLTSVETAATCDAWSCVAVDPNFPATIYFDNDGIAACFDEDGTLTYLQYLGGDSQPGVDQVRRDQKRIADEWSMIQADRSATLRLENTHRIIRNPMTTYSRENLEFECKALTEIDLSREFDLIRCMNVFMYFSGHEMKSNVHHAKRLLSDGGYFYCGSSTEVGSAVRYLLCQKQDSILVPRFFGFDVGKLSTRAILGWWSFHKDQLDTTFLSQMVRVITRRPKVFDRISDVVDHVERELGYSHRDSEGFLHQKGFLEVSEQYRSVLSELFTECGSDIQQAFAEDGISVDLNDSGMVTVDIQRSTNETANSHFRALY